VGAEWITQLNCFGRAFYFILKVNKQVIRRVRQLEKKLTDVKNNDSEQGKAAKPHSFV